MITVARAREKLWELSISFSRHYAARNWSRAKYCYTTARNIAVFMELSESEMTELFGSREEPDKPVEGLFKENEVMRVMRESIKKDR